MTITPSDLGLPSGGWLPGHYYYVLKIDANRTLASDEVWLVGNDPTVADEESRTPVYGYTQRITTDKDLSNKDGVIIAGSTQPVWDYFTTTFFNNDDQTNGNYWTPTGNVPPAFKARHTLNYVPDDTAKQAGLTAGSVTKAITLNANGQNQKSAGYTPGHFGWSVWPSGLYYWSTEINNQDNKSLAKFCGANADVPCMQNESRILNRSVAPGQVVVTGDPTSTDGEGWVADGKTVWNGAGTTEALTSLRQTYDANHKPVITANDHEGNVSRDLANGKGENTLNYVPDDPSKQAGLTAKSVTKAITLNANGQNQKSAGYVPGDFNWSVWPSGLYHWSTEIKTPRPTTTVRARSSWTRWKASTPSSRNGP